MAITNEAELKKALQGQIQSAVNTMMGELQEEGYNKIKSEVYSYPSTEYIRTGEFMDAWKAEESGDIGNIANGTYDYDAEEIHTFGEWGVHQSFVTGESSAEELPNYIYNGYQGALNKKVPARNVFKKLDKWFSERQVVSQFKSGLKKAGLKLTKAGGADKTTI